ncbi:MAG TPA: hypothetical protein VFT91_11145, partial [Dehalococcoidia bacterium]|nr:hypothetical protein [Dehalococcoidia bacterium]
MTQPSDRERLFDYLLRLYGGDPFAQVREASNTHREAHGGVDPALLQECGVYPSDPQKMRLIGTIARAAGA